MTKIMKAKTLAIAIQARMPRTATPFRMTTLETLNLNPTRNTLIPHLDTTNTSFLLLV